MVVLMTARKAEALGIKPLAKFVSFGVRGLDPCVMGLGPKMAVPIALARAGLTIDQMDVIEINEAFAAQAIPCIRPALQGVCLRTALFALCFRICICFSCFLRLSRRCCGLNCCILCFFCT